MSDAPYVIVGAGHSGVKAAAALRKQGCTGRIVLAGEETHLPYDRPPLSKAVLLGKKTGEQCALFPLSWFTDNAIELSINDPVTGIDRFAHSIVLESGRDVPYDCLLLATGSALDQLNVPGADLAGVSPLRSPPHAETIAKSLRAGQRLVIIGAGVIGLEVAAAAAELGCVVHVLEAAPKAMARSLPEPVSSAIVAKHLKHGVDLRFGARVAALEGDQTVAAVRLEDGETIGCDVVVYGIGVTPRTELAQAAGLSVDNGIRTSNLLQTADERIFACGDVCRYESALFGIELRLENWRNAEEQAVTAARNMRGDRQAFDEVPWFWSNQYDCSLQVFGLPNLGTITTTHDVGNSAIFLSFDEQGILRGASGFGPVKEIAAPLRKLKAAIATRHAVEQSGIVNPDVVLQTLLGL